MNTKVARSCRNLFVILLVTVFLFTNAGVSGSNVLAQAGDIGFTDTIINGPSVPPSGFDAQRAPVEIYAQSSAVLSNVPAYSWVMGSSAVSAAMIAGYYDHSGFPNMYNGPTNAGLIPLTDSSWSRWKDVNGDEYPNNPLVASHNGLDGRTTRGSIDDYWVQFNSALPDPFIANPPEHPWGDAVSDYMKTSQSTYFNNDGATHFYNKNSSKKLNCSEMPGLTDPTYHLTYDKLDGTYGRKLFYEARGYAVSDCYNQYTDNNYSGGFSLANFKTEINAGRPVLLNLENHSVVGIGYSTSTKTIYIHDTWDANTHTMDWGGSYSTLNLKLISVSIVIPVSAPNPISPTGEITAERPAYKWSKASGATGYQLKVTNTDTSEVVINKAVATSSCSGSVCSTTPAVTLTGINYQFEVASTTSLGQSDFSAPLAFKEARHVVPGTPVLVAPNGLIWIQKPAYKWNPLLAATSYVLTVTNNDTHTVVVTKSVTTSACTSTSCSYTPSINLAHGNYQFEVAAKNAMGQGAFGGPMPFQEVYDTPPAVPTLLSPSGSIWVLKPAYKWTPTVSATGYVLKVTNNGTPAVVVLANVSKSACSSTTCSYTPAYSLTDGNYQFEVAAKNAYGQSAFSVPPLTFTEVYHSIPAVPTPISPSGTIWVLKPVYKWLPSVSSTGYVLKVTNTGTAGEVDANVSTSACTSTICSYTPAVSLLDGNYQFEVAAKNSIGQSAFSVPMTFHVAGFNSQFNGSSAGWIAQPGGLWNTTSTYYTTAGSADKWSTSRYDATYDDFDYSARIKRVGGISYHDSTYWAPANCIFVRMGGNFDADNYWWPGYSFCYYEWGSMQYTPTYGIYRKDSSGTGSLIAYYNTNFVVKNNWNTLRISTYGATLMFYINNNLVYIYTDTAASSGSVGLGMATLQGATSTTYNVDWATLSQYLGPAAEETISPEQQAFNEAGKNNPTDSLTPEKGRPLQP